MPPANQLTINLLNVDTNTNSPFNRIMIWITTYGRYIMITTELIVLLAFASRFSLDRKLSDLKENITQKQEILEVNIDLENEIRRTQDKISSIKFFLRDQHISIDTLILIYTLLPAGTYLETLNIDNNKLTANVAANSSDSFTRNLNENRSHQMT